MAERVDLSAIRLDGGTQPRAAIDPALVETYADDMGRGDPFPAPIVFFDGADYWLADGFHRVHAAGALKWDGLLCEVRQGTQRDAILYSVGANDSHGLRRTNEDKHRAVMRLMDDAEWSQWSDNDIRRTCRVSLDFVQRRRSTVTYRTVSEASPAPTPPEVPTPVREKAEAIRQAGGQPRFYNNRHGHVSVMDTAKIGGGAPQAVEPPTAAPAVPAEAPDSTTFHADRFIHARVLAVAEALSQLPAPADAARRYPNILRASFSADQARDIADWFSAFADAWEAENGARHVAA